MRRRIEMPITTQQVEIHTYFVGVKEPQISALSLEVNEENGSIYVRFEKVWVPAEKREGKIILNRVAFKRTINPGAGYRSSNG
jgi:hypothetical protein